MPTNHILKSKSLLNGTLGNLYTDYTVVCRDHAGMTFDNQLAIGSNQMFTTEPIHYKHIFNMGGGMYNSDGLTNQHNSRV